MTVIEALGTRRAAEPKGSKLRNSAELETDKLINNTISTVLLCLPHRRRLQTIARDGRVIPVRVGDVEWKFKVEAGDKPLVLMTTTNPKTNEICTYGIATDPEIKKITGVFREVGEQKLALGISPIDLKSAMKELRRNERGRALRSFWRTHSIETTSQHLGIPVSRVKAHIEAYKKYLARPKIPKHIITTTSAHSPKKSPTRV
ncbi:MAG: hypothetical protein ABH816_03980 [Candidatus Levyibacteriota bacterium]